jgi:hypothetical protein
MMTHHHIGIHFQPRPSYILFHPAYGWIARAVDAIFGNLQLLTELLGRTCVLEQRHDYESEEIQNQYKASVAVEPI